MKRHVPLSWKDEHDRLEREMLSTPVAAIGLTVRLQNSLLQGGINCVGDILDKTPRELLACCENFGPEALKQLFKCLEQSGLSLTLTDPVPTLRQHKDIARNDVYTASWPEGAACAVKRAA